MTRKVSQLVEFNDGAIAAIAGLAQKTIWLDRNTELLLQGESGSAIYIIVEGWACCYKDVEDGARQIINFQLPGDFLGLRFFFLKRSDLSFATLTRCHLLRLLPKDGQDLFDAHPSLAQILLNAIAREEAVLAEHLVNVGRRTAEQRIAHLLCELGHRLETRGLLSGNAFDIPIAQEDIADAVGLSVVHLNRTLRRLRSDGLVRSQTRGLYVPDFEKLRAYAKFDNSYLR